MKISNKQRIPYLCFKSMSQVAFERSLMLALIFFIMKQKYS